MPGQPAGGPYPSLGREAHIALELGPSTLQRSTAPRATVASVSASQIAQWPGAGGQVPVAACSASGVGALLWHTQPWHRRASDRERRGTCATILCMHA